MSTLEELSVTALSRGPAQAVEYEKRWISWDEMRQVADRVNGLIDASGADPRAPVALIPRNRPSALAALLGLIARGRHIRMVHVYQSPAGLVRDIVRLKPAVVVGAAEDCPLKRSVRHCRRAASPELRSPGWAPPRFPDANARPPPAIRRRAAPQIDLLTSGTTGPPKQFALSYDMIAKQMVGVNVMPIADTPSRQAVAVVALLSLR